MSPERRTNKGIQKYLFPLIETLKVIRETERVLRSIMYEPEPIRTVFSKRDVSGLNEVKYVVWRYGRSE